MFNLSNLFKKEKEADAIENNEAEVSEELDSVRYEDADYEEDEEEEKEADWIYKPFEDAFKEVDTVAETEFNELKNPFFVFVLETVYGTAYLIRTSSDEDLEDLKGLIKITPVEITKEATVLKKTEEATNLAIYTNGKDTDLENVLIPVDTVGSFSDGKCLISEYEDAISTIYALTQDYSSKESYFEWPKIYFTVLPSWKNAEENKYIYAKTSFYVYENEEEARNNYYSRKWLKKGGKLYKCQVAKSDIKTRYPEFLKVAADVLISA